MARKRIRNVESSNISKDAKERQESKVGNCPHVGKGIDIGSVKKAWKKKDVLSCQQCKKRNNVSKKESSSDQDVWICMKCGNVGCGYSRFNHGQEHYDTPRSDCHAIVAQMDLWTVRCLQCKSDINLDVNTRASAAMEYLKRHFGNLKEEKEEVEEVPNAEEKVHIKLPVTAQESKKSTPTSHIKHQPFPVLGLENIGNTCYMNAVLQALTQTPGFVSELEFLSGNNGQFALKGGDNLINKEYGGYLPSLEGKLGEAGQLTKAVLKLTRRVKDGLHLRKSGVANENPGDIIRVLKKYSNTFYIGEQHDSHEFLRLLLEGLRTEDFKRYQRGILNSLGICTPGNEVTEREREQFTAYKKQAMENELAVDKIFGGSFVSILKCIECGEITTTFENFMDISLPVESEKPKPFHVERCANHEENKPSKHQLKKERKMARRGRKKNRGGKNVSELNSSVETNKMQSSSESASESEADVEDNLDSETTAGSNVFADSNISNSESDKTAESCGYTADESMLNTSSSEKQDDFDTSELIHPSTPEAVPLISGSSPEHSLVLQSSDPCTIICNYSPEPSMMEDFGSCEGGRGSPASSIEQADWEEESNNKGDVSVKSTIKDLQISDDSCPPLAPYEFSEEDNVKEGDTTKEVTSDSLLDSFCSKSEAGESLDRKGKATDELTCYENSKQLRIDELGEDKDIDRNHCDFGSNRKPSGDAAINSSVMMNVDDLHLDNLGWGATLTSQPELEEKVFSAYHCLNQFFSKETLTGGNKIGCLQCTKLKNGQETKTNSKLVMANAYKQLLFLKLPNVLTVHLKRFEVLRSRMSKITRKVSFPLVLDVAPYTSSKSKINENLAKYELYAVVEHSGHMTSGHYVAYVRVDPEKSEKNFNIEEQDKNGIEVEFEAKNNKNKTSEAVEKPSVKWYLISDTHVREVTSNEVLSAEAYILFYKRLN